MSTIRDIDAIAIKKAGNIPNWFPYEYISTDSGIIVKGCNTSIKTRGKNKGDKKWNTKIDHKTVVISDEELSFNEG